MDELYRRHQEFFGLHDVAERLLDFDERVHLFRFHHLKLAQRIIGGGVVGTMGTPVEVLHQRMEHLFYKELWDVRNRITAQSMEGLMWARAPRSSLKLTAAAYGRCDQTVRDSSIADIIAAILPLVYNQIRRAGVAQW